VKELIKSELNNNTSQNQSNRAISLFISAKKQLASWRNTHIDRRSSDKWQREQ